MWAILGFILASIIGLTAVLRGGRSRNVRREEYPWLLDEISVLRIPSCPLRSPPLAVTNRDQKAPKNQKP